MIPMKTIELSTQARIVALIETNPAIALLAQLDGGRVVTDLAEKYPQVVEAVKRTGRPGELTLKLKIAPDGKGDVQTVEVHGKVVPNIPTPVRRGTVFFVTEDNQLSRQDPNQKEIDFAGAARVAAAGTK